MTLPQAIVFSVVGVALLQLGRLKVAAILDAREKKITLLVSQMRNQWREQQGPIAKHFNDYLPLTDDLVREWFAKRGENWPRNWELLLLNYDAENKNAP